MRVRNSLLISVFTALLAPASALAGTDDAVKVSIIDKSGKQIGEAHLGSVSDGVKIAVKAVGLSDNGHGLHIHSNGACDPPAFESAGNHYQPEESSHGFLHSEGPHAGDLPMLKAGPDGRVTDYEYTTDRVALTKDSLLKPGGTSLVIHEKPDDYLTDGGGTGDRIACGVISPADKKKTSD